MIELDQGTVSSSKLSLNQSSVSLSYLNNTSSLIDSASRNTEMFSFSVFIEDKHNKYFFTKCSNINAENWTR